MMTDADLKRIKEDRGPLDLTLKIEQLELSNKKLKDQVKEAGKINQLHQELCEELKKRAQEAEGENTIIKGIGQNSPEMKALQKEVEELKAELSRAKEDHQYDNLVHQNELQSLRKK
tara:strand:- start:342 stop:692 length:351 start_codon:yes stop_codon:yes gene_type:complete